MVDSARLLGFAFANADFLFEVDGHGAIEFATGASNELIHQPPEALIGCAAEELFLPFDASKFVTFARALGKGERAGPFRMRLVGGAAANV